MMNLSYYPDDLLENYTEGKYEEFFQILIQGMQKNIHSDDVKLKFPNFIHQKNQNDE